MNKYKAFKIKQHELKWKTRNWCSGKRENGKAGLGIRLQQVNNNF